MPHKRALERVHPRAEKRLAISADSAEREAQGLPLNPSLSQPYPVPKAWLSHFPLERTSAETDRLLETERQDKSGGHAGERSGQSDALQWNDTQATSSTHATATSASSADGGSGSTDATNAETTVDD